MIHSTLITPADLAAHLGDASYVIVDVRHDLAQPAWGESEYRRAHLPNAQFAHLDRDLSAAKTGANGRHPLPAPEACAELFGRLGIDATKHVVAYDQGSSMYAARLWWMLRWLGHEKVAVLDGGISAWLREGRPVSDAVVPVPPARFEPRRSYPTVDAQAVLASLDARSLLVIDARGRERFRGDVDPIDPVAGHIPGSVNRPYLDNYAADGALKPAETLRAEFAALIGGRPVETVVHSCGSGVSACVNLLAMEHAGLGRARLYPGSWSEWCADRSRPVARGDA